MSRLLESNKSVSWDQPRFSRAVAALTSGHLAILTYDGNTIDNSGAAGDHIPRLKLSVWDKSEFHESQGNVPTSTAKATAVIPVGPAYASNRSIQIGSIVTKGNVIYIVYNFRNATGFTDERLVYQKLTWNGTNSVTSNATVTVHTLGSTGVYEGVDIDIDAGGTATEAPLIGYTTNLGSGNITSYVTQWGTTGSAFGSATTILSPCSKNISIAMNQQDAASTTKGWVASLNSMDFNYDYGDAIFKGTSVTTTGVTTKTSLIEGLNISQSQGLRDLHAYFVGNVAIITGVSNYSPYKQFVAGYKITTAGVSTVVLAPTNITDDSFSLNRSNQTAFQKLSSQIHPNINAISTYIGDGTNNRVWNKILKYTIDGGETSLTMQLLPSKWHMDNSLPYVSGQVGLISSLSSGDRGVYISGQDMYLVTTDGNQGTRASVVHYRNPISFDAMSVNIATTNGSTVYTGSPLLDTLVTSDLYYTMKGFVKVTVAKDAGFTLSVTTFYSPLMVFDTNNYSNHVFVQLNLGQGTWYLKAQIEDQRGIAGTASATSTLTISHQPVVSLLAPLNNGMAAYDVGTSVVPVDFQFTDIDYLDYQTAAQVRITTTAGVNVYNMGKVTTNATRMLVPIPSGSLNSYLKCYASVWDRDDVVSAEVVSDFYFAARPVVVVASPTTNQVLTTSTPTFSWSITPGGRTQVSRSIVIKKTSGEVIYTNSATTGTMSFIVPVSYLKNNSSYSVTISVVDNLGFTGTTTVFFSLLFTAPAICPAVIVDLTYYDEMGFANISAMPPTIAVDQQPYNTLLLMRRSFNSDDSWQIVKEFPTTQEYQIFIDSTLPSGVESYYCCVLRVTSGSDIIEGDPDSAYITKVNPAGHYWLIDSVDHLYNTMIQQVTSEDFDNEVEQETLIISERGRWVDQGDDIGVKGTLVAKFRDREFSLGGNPVTNYLVNPRFTNDGSGGSTGVTGWTLDPSTVYLNVKPISPSPTGTKDCFAMGSSSVSNISQIIRRDYLASDLNNILSVWVDTSRIAQAASGKSVSFMIVCKDSANSTITTVNQAFSLSTSGAAFIPSGAVTYPSQVSAKYDWYRLDKAFTTPANTYKMTVQITFTTTNSADRLIIGGAQFINSSNTGIKFFDGYTHGAEWVSAEVQSKSYSTGEITARSIRRRVMDLLKGKRDLYLRNPFGDIFRVASGDISASRISGVGQNEFVDITIPYLEIGNG